MQGEIPYLALLMLSAGTISSVVMGGGGSQIATADALPQDAEDNDVGLDQEEPQASVPALPGDAPSAVQFRWVRDGGYDNAWEGTSPDPLSGLGGNDEFFGDTTRAINSKFFGGELTDPDSPYSAFGGNDFFRGGWGDDWLLGQNGNDTLYGDSGDDWLNGSPGDDTLFGGHGQDHAHGGTGNDRIYLGFGDDINIYAPVYIALFEQGSIDAFHAAMDDDRDGSLFIDNEDPNPEYRQLWVDSGAEGMLVAGRDVGVTEAAADRYGLDSDRADQRLIYDNLGDDLIRGGARLSDADGNYIEAGYFEDGNDTLIDPMGSNTIYGDLGDDVIMTFDRALYYSDRDDNGIRDFDDPQHSELEPDTIFGGYGSDLIFADAGDLVTLDPVLDDVDFADRLVVGSEFSEFNTDKTINQETVTVTDFNPDQDQLVIMNYIQSDGAPSYEGLLSFEAITGGTAVMIGTQNVVTLEGVGPDQLTLGSNVIHDTDKTPGESAVGAIFANFNAT